MSSRENRSEQTAAACGFRWKAQRIPTPGIPRNHVELLHGGGVVVNATMVPQECVEPKGHDGPHRSRTNVVRR